MITDGVHINDAARIIDEARGWFLDNGKAHPPGPAVDDLILGASPRHRGGPHRQV